MEPCINRWFMSSLNKRYSQPHRILLPESMYTDQSRFILDDVTKRFLFHKAEILTNSLDLFKHWNVKYCKRGKMLWAKYSRFQPYEVSCGNTFAGHWPPVDFVYLQLKFTEKLLRSSQKPRKFSPANLSRSNKVKLLARISYKLSSGYELSSYVYKSTPNKLIFNWRLY